jgi:hypothetical protein
MSNTIEAYIGKKGKEKVTFKECRTVNGIRLFKYDGNYYKITRSSDGRNIATIENTKLSSPASSDTEDKTSTVQEQELDTNVYYYSNVEGKDYPSSKESYNSDMSNAVNEKCLAYPINEGLLGKEIDSQKFIDFSHFSNFTSVNSSYIKVDFKSGNGSGDWVSIDTKQMNSYIVGLSSDNQGGVQKITLELFDRDFNVLDGYINNAIKFSQSTNIVNTEAQDDINSTVESKYKNDIIEIRKENESGTATEYIKSLDKQIIDLNIKISNLTSHSGGKSDTTEWKNQMNTLILKRRASLSTPPTIDIEKTPENKSGIVPNLKITFGYTDENYNTKQWETAGTSYNSSIKSSKSDSRWQEGKDIDYSNSSSENTDVTRDAISNFTHENQSTIRTPTFTLFITGLKSSVSSSGIHYTIEAMEIQELELLNYRVVERYTTLKGTPKDIMHYFMNAFNDGGISDSNIRLIWADKVPIYEEKDFPEENKKIDNNASDDSADGKDNAVSESSTTDANDIPIKEISISLGGKNAEENGYWDGTRFIGATSFKSISSLFDDYCNACPRAPDYSSVITKDSTQKDEKGNDIPIQNSMDFSTRKMGWRVMKKLPIYKKKDNGEEDKETIIGYTTYIGFYYIKPKKFEFIRRYVWGNGSYGNTVVKNISLETENEYGLLSAQTTIDSVKNVTKRKIFSLGVESQIPIQQQTDKSGKLINNSYKNEIATSGAFSAYENCVYRGTMTVIGDPSYMFGEVLLPYEYPIYIDILIKGSSSDGESSRITRHHYSSGFYVVTGIKHDISTSGYVTTLSVMTYPGIENQILINKS